MNYKKKTKHFSMKELPVSEQPYEKCLHHGAKYLSDSELLAVIIRTGSSGERSVELTNRVLSSMNNQTLSGLYQATFDELKKIHGIGKVKAIQLLCLAECSRRMNCSLSQEETLICIQPQHIADYFMSSMRCLETEQVRLLILDGKNAMKQSIIISKGSFNASYASPREIFYYALKHGAVSIILLHNHPSGDAAPSREDVRLTKRLADTGELVGIPLLDHIVIGDNQFTSLKESGYL